MPGSHTQQCPDVVIARPQAEGMTNLEVLRKTDSHHILYLISNISYLISYLSLRHLHQTFPQSCSEFCTIMLDNVPARK